MKRQTRQHLMSVADWIVDTLFVVLLMQWALGCTPATSPSSMNVGTPDDSNEPATAVVESADPWAAYTVDHLHRLCWQDWQRRYGDLPVPHNCKTSGTDWVAPGTQPGDEAPPPARFHYAWERSEFTVVVKFVHRGETQVFLHRP